MDFQLKYTVFAFYLHLLNKYKKFKILISRTSHIMLTFSEGLNLADDAKFMLLSTLYDPLNST